MPSIRSVLLVSALVAAPAFAKDDVQYEITAETGDGVAKGKDVVVEELRQCLECKQKTNVYDGQP